MLAQDEFERIDACMNIRQKITAVEFVVHRLNLDVEICFTTVISFWSSWIFTLGAVPGRN